MALSGDARDDRRVWLRTGILGLDTILSGGLLQGGLYLIEGQVGTGKTVLGVQCGITYAKRGGRVLVVTLLAESHGRLIDHLRGFDFFDGTVIARSFFLLSGYGAAKKGLPDLVRLLAEALTKEKPQLLIIDGFSGARAFAHSEAEYAHFLLELNALVTAAGCTALLLASFEGNSAAPHHALVDGIIELSTAEFGARRIRELEVHKFRGANPITGRHAFAIAKPGLLVFPRFESLARSTSADARRTPPRTFAFGLPELDEMLRGGLLEGSSTAIVGLPGAGKTTLGLKFLQQGVKDGEATLYFGFYEQGERLLSKAAGLGIHFDDSDGAGRVVIKWVAPLELLLDEVVQELFHLMDEVRPTRVLIDGMAAFRDAVVNPERMQPFMAALLLDLLARGCATVFTEELPLSAQPTDAASRAASLMDNIIQLRLLERGENIERLLSLIKIREGDHDLSFRRLEIGASGVRVAPWSGTDSRAGSP